MVITGPIADDEVAAAGGRPFTASNASSFARQPATANLHNSNNNYPAAASYVAGTAPTSSLPPFPSSTTATASYWPSNYSASSSLPQQHHHPWQHQQLQHAAPASSSSYFLADSGTQAGDDEFFAAMLGHLSGPQSATTPFAHLPVPPQVQMQFATTQAYAGQHQAMAAPAEAVPLAAVPANVAAAANGPAQLPDEAAANKPAPRRRGRPRKDTAAAGPTRPAPRRKAPASNSATAASRRARQPAAAQATNNAAVAVADTSGESVPCIILTALPGQAEQCPPQSSSSTSTPSPRRRGRPGKNTDRPAAAAPRRRKASVVAESAAALPLLPDEEEDPVVEAAMESYADTAMPGVRFQPSNEEIIGFLRIKYLGRKMPVDFIRDFNVYHAHPETVQASCGESVDGCWYVFSPRTRRYPNGGRPARSVGDVGFWKSNTKETDILVDGEVIGKVTALTFELGHQPKGTQTPWKMREYSIPEKQHKPNVSKNKKRHKPDGSNMLLDDWVLCKIFCNRHDDNDPEMVLAEEGDQLDDFDEDADETEGDEDMQIAAVEQGDQLADAGQAASETEGDVNMQIVPDEQPWSNSEQDFRVEDYIVCDPTFGDQNRTVN